MPNGRRLDDTLAEFDDVVERAWEDRSALGIFPSMYRAVTLEIRDGLGTRFFDDGDALEELSIIFADRYFEAFRALVDGGAPTRSWEVAFRAAQGGRRRMVLQHLLAGMNAHINLDLGIVTAEIAGDRPEALHADFLRVNYILYEKVNGLQAYLNAVSPTMAVFDRLGGFLDEMTMRAIISVSRDRAWDLAMDLLTKPDQRDATIARRDRFTAELGRLIVGERLPVRPVSWLITLREPGDVRQILDSFLARPVDLDVVEAAVQRKVDRGVG
jgi:Family of unknown function (DUF5995)